MSRKAKQKKFRHIRKHYADPVAFDTTIHDTEQTIELAAQRLAQHYIATNNRKIPPAQHRLFYLGVPLERRDEVTRRCKELVNESMTVRL